jgi:hypothetical protein
VVPARVGAALLKPGRVSTGGRLFLIETVVAEHDPEHVDASSGEGQDSLGVPLALSSFAVARRSQERPSVIRL